MQNSGCHRLEAPKDSAHTKWQRGFGGQDLLHIQVSRLSSGHPPATWQVAGTSSERSRCTRWAEGDSTRVSRVIQAHGAANAAWATCFRRSQEERASESQEVKRLQMSLAQHVAWHSKSLSPQAQHPFDEGRACHRENVECATLEATLQARLSFIDSQVHALQATLTAAPHVMSSAVGFSSQLLRKRKTHILRKRHAAREVAKNRTPKTGKRARAPSLHCWPLSHTLIAELYVAAVASNLSACKSSIKRSARRQYPRASQAQIAEFRLITWRPNRGHAAGLLTGGTGFAQASQDHECSSPAATLLTGAHGCVEADHLAPPKLLREGQVAMRWSRAISLKSVSAAPQRQPFSQALIEAL